MKFITQAGSKKLKEQLKKYEQRRAKIMLMKAEAAELGGDKWLDNFSFEQIECLQKVYDSRISELKIQIRESVVLTEEQLKNNAQKNRIAIGSKVKIKYQNNKTSVIEITGSGESVPDRGLIAYDSPLGKALFNKKPGQKTTFVSNGKKTEIKMIELLKNSQ